MTKVIQCPCGFVISESDEDSLVKSAQEHARGSHGMELSREQALAMAKPQRAERSASSGQGSDV